MTPPNKHCYLRSTQKSGVDMSTPYETHRKKCRSDHCVVRKKEDYYV